MDKSRSYKPMEILKLYKECGGGRILHVVLEEQGWVGTEDHGASRRTYWHKSVYKTALDVALSLPKDGIFFREDLERIAGNTMSASWCWRGKCWKQDSTGSLWRRDKKAYYGPEAVDPRLKATERVVQGLDTKKAYRFEDIWAESVEAGGLGVQPYRQCCEPLAGATRP